MKNNPVAVVSNDREMFDKWVLKNSESVIDYVHVFDMGSAVGLFFSGMIFIDGHNYVDFEVKKYVEAHIKDKI